MATYLPTDDNNQPIPAMRLRDGGAHSIAVSASSARNSTAIAGETRVISLYATVPVYIRFGGASVTATSSDHYFPAGVYYDVSIGGEHAKHTPYLAALRAEGDGTVYISEKE